MSRTHAANLQPLRPAHERRVFGRCAECWLQTSMEAIKTTSQPTRPRRRISLLRKRSFVGSSDVQQLAPIVSEPTPSKSEGTPPKVRKSSVRFSEAEDSEMEDEEDDVMAEMIFRPGHEDGKMFGTVEPATVQFNRAADDQAWCAPLAQMFRCFAQDDGSFKKDDSADEEEDDYISSVKIEDMLRQCTSAPMALRPGEVLIEQQQPSKGIYLVLSGKLVVSRSSRKTSDPSKSNDPKAKKAFTYTLGKGAVIGEISFLLGTPSLYTVKAAQKELRRASVARLSSLASAINKGDQLVLNGGGGGGTFNGGALSGSVLSQVAMADTVADPLHGAQSAFDESTHGGERSNAQAVVCELTHEQAHYLIQNQPDLTQKLFHAMAIPLSRRVIAASDFKVANASSPGEAQEGTARVSTGDDSSELLYTSMAKVSTAKRTAYEIAQAFSLPIKDPAAADRLLLASAGPCQIIEEQNQLVSATKLTSDATSELYLFETHLCIEETGFLLFNKRRSFPIDDVLRVLTAPPPPGGSKMPVAVDKRMLELELKGARLRIVMISAQCESFQDEVERARLRYLSAVHIEDIRDQAPAFYRASTAVHAAVRFRDVESPAANKTRASGRGGRRSSPSQDASNTSSTPSPGGWRPYSFAPHSPMNGHSSDSPPGSSPPQSVEDSFHSFHGGQDVDAIKGFKPPGMRNFRRQLTRDTSYTFGSSFSFAGSFKHHPTSKRGPRSPEAAVLTTAGSSLGGWRLGFLRARNSASGLPTGTPAKPRRRISPPSWANPFDIGAPPAPSPGTPPKERPSSNQPGPATPPKQRPSSNQAGEGGRRDGSAPVVDQVRRMSSSVSHEEVEKSFASFNQSKPGARSSLNSALTDLTESEWASLLTGARYRKYEEGQKVIVRNRMPGGLLQVVRGTIRLEVELPGRPHAQVIGRLKTGEILGEMAFLLGQMPAANAVCESATAAVVRLPYDHLHDLFDTSPTIATKFYYFLTMRAAERLRSVAREEIELVHDQATAKAFPKTIEALFGNPAFAVIVRQFVNSSPESLAEFGNITAFICQVIALQTEGDGALVRALFQRTYQTFIAPDAKRSIAQFFVENNNGAGAISNGNTVGSPLKSSISGASVIKTVRSKCLETLGPSDSAGRSPQDLRHLFDAVITAAYRSLQTRLLNKFIRSTHYDYILNLKYKESEFVSLDHFYIGGFLGEGGFGQVYTATKRDCGKRYAMKVMHKPLLKERFREVWEAVAILERSVSPKHSNSITATTNAATDADPLNIYIILCSSTRVSFLVHLLPHTL